MCVCVQVNEDGKSVRRNPDKAVPDIFDVEFRKGMMDRTVYAVSLHHCTPLTPSPTPPPPPRH